MENNLSANLKMTPKDFFLHLGAIAVLYVGFGALINLLFRLIDAVRPGLEPTHFGSISWPVAALMVLFPLYLVLMWLIGRDQTLKPETVNLAIRRWLVYLTLFLAGTIIVGNLITVLYFFLDGRIITAGFWLKALSLLILAVLIFVFYLLDLRGRLPAVGYRVFAGLGAMIILASIMAGFMIMGSPATQRAVRADDIRLSHLQDIQWRITDYWQATGRLPAELADLADSLSYQSVPTDPETNQPYDYEVMSDRHFRLCAEFNLASDNRSTGGHRPTIGDDNWQYQAGRFCFDREIDPERYPRR